MTIKAESNRVGLYFKAETNWGETPAGGAFTQLRYTGESLDRDKQTARSATIRADRMTDELAVLGFSVAGDINFEMSYGSFDDFIEAVMGGTWTTFTSGALTLTMGAVALGAVTLTRSAGSFITDGIIPSAWIKVGSFGTNPGNNGKFLVKAVTSATVLELWDPDAVTVAEVGTGVETYAFDFIANGTTKRSFVVEKQFTDLTKFQYFNGLRLGSMELDITAMQLITGKFAFMGKDAVAAGATVTGSLVPSGTNSIMSASANVAKLVKDGATLSTGIKQLKIQLDNTLRKQDIVGSQATGGIAYGEFAVKGSLEAYFEDLTLLNNVIAHDTVALGMQMKDTAGKSVFIQLPALKLTKGNPKVAGGNQDVTIPCDFEAIRDVPSDSMVVISRFAA